MGNVKSLRTLFLIVLAFILAAFYFLLHSAGLIAAADQSDFSFPSCSNVLPQAGDLAHYTYGMHQIVGGPLLPGSDDVYSLDNGNYLQCFCPVEGDTGIQTNWLRSEAKLDGWFYEFGAQWNLGNFYYNAQNISFSCNPESTPTPTPTPRATPTATPTATPNETPGPKGPPTCNASKPGTPTILSVAGHGTSVDLTWTSVSGATYYSIVYGNVPGKFSFGVANVGNVTSYTINGLDPNQTYHFGVNAVNDCMPGDIGEFNGGTGGQVLGASTMAETGTFAENLYLSIMICGTLFTFLGVKALKKV